MTLTGPGIPAANGVYMAIISNTSPWTYVGNRPVPPTPWAGFETGLDLLGAAADGPARDAARHPADPHGA